MFKYFRSKGFWVFIITALVLIFIIRSGLNDSVHITGMERLTRESYAPLQMGVDKIQQGITRFGIVVLGLTDYEAELQAAKEKNNQLSLENMQLRNNKAEVERLRSLLEYKQAHGDQYNLEVARVIARSPNNWYETLTIDRGSDNGLSVNMPVINPDGLVGKIVNVSSGSAQVLLLTDREMAVGVILQETRENRGIVEGMGKNRELRMINIPYYSPVREGERVVTSGLSQIYPPGLQIGIIKDIKKEEASGLVLTATVDPFVDFDRLEEVLVIRSFTTGADSDSKGV